MNRLYCLKNAAIAAPLPSWNSTSYLRLFSSSDRVTLFHHGHGSNNFLHFQSPRIGTSVYVRSRREREKEENEDEATAAFSEANRSGTTARGRRLLMVREEKRKREYDRQHNYPAWAKVLEDACKDDVELRAVLGDSIGNPELMRKRVERIRKKGRDFRKSKTGSVLAFKVSFREWGYFYVGS